MGATGTVRTSCVARTVPAVGLFRHKQTSSLCIITDHEQDDLGEDAVNAWSTCEAGEPEAAAVARSQETRLSDGCLPVGRAASAAKKAHRVGEALVIAACHSWPLRHSCKS